MQARARARARARSLGDRARSLDCRPLRIRIALALPASAGMTSRKAAVLVLAIGADDPAVIETARAYETAMKERGGTVEAKHFSTGRRLRFARGQWAGPHGNGPAERGARRARGPRSSAGARMARTCCDGRTASPQAPRGAVPRRRSPPPSRQWRWRAAR